MRLGDLLRREAEELGATTVRLTGLVGGWLPREDRGAAFLSTTDWAGHRVSGIVGHGVVTCLGGIAVRLTIQRQG